MEKIFSSNNIIWYAFDSKFAAFTDFEKRQVFVQQLSKKNFRTYLRNLTIPVAFYGKFAIIWWWEIFEFRIVLRSSARTIGM